MLARPAIDVALRRAIVFPATQPKDIVGLRVCLVGVVEEKNMLIIHEFTSSGGGADVRKARWKKEREATLWLRGCRHGVREGPEVSA